MAATKHILAGLGLAAALSFNSAAQAGSCLDDMQALFDTYDTRPETPTHYYFEKEEIEGDQGIRTAIKTAVKTGNYEEELVRLSQLSWASGLMVQSLVNMEFDLCARFGTFDAIPEANKQIFTQLIPAFVAVENQSMDVIKYLESQGRDLITNGTPPVPKDEFVALFR